MKRTLSLAILSIWLCTTAFAQQQRKGPEIDLIDNKLSINAESMPLSRLLRLFDLATGMTSKVPPELANRNVSVKFSGLNVEDGVKKMFQGQPLDYVMIQGRGIVVTAPSQSGGSDVSSSSFSPPPQPIEQPYNQFIQDSQPPAGVIQGQAQQQPATIQTPFGPMPNPRANQPAQQPNAPLSMPGQQNSLFPSTQPQQINQPQPVSPPFPGAQPGVNTNPFNSPSPFGAPSQPQQNPNSLFGAPPISSTPGGVQGIK